MNHDIKWNSLELKGLTLWVLSI